MLLLPALALAAAFDGQAALRHASALAALGPHAWGSPRALVAAQYVAAQFHEAGLEEVRLQEFETKRVRGANVIGVLRAPGPEFVVVGAHHDTAPEAPGAYDDGGGVGVLIESARLLAKEKTRSRTLVFVSFDGEEAWSTGLTTTAGSRAYLAALGQEARHLVAAFAIEMSGFAGGRPSFHPIAYADPLRPGATVVAPAWLMRAALAGARDGGQPLAVGDPWLSWLYQPAVRTFRASLYGDDLSFLQAGRPALFASDSSFSAFYPHYHRDTDTADKLDADALGRMGRGVLGVVRALERVRPAAGDDADWFSAFGLVLGRFTLLGLGVASLLPTLLRARSAAGLERAARLAHAALAALLLWRHPVPALWLLLLPNLAAVSGRIGFRLAALLPAAALAALGLAAWQRGMVGGLWLTHWELIAAGLVLGLAGWGSGGGAPRAPLKKTTRRRR